MRTWAFTTLALSLVLTRAFGQDVDYTKFAYAERTQLAKCFSDMLTVVKRHRLRSHLGYFLEGGCEAEMRNYRAALVPHVPKEFQDWPTELKERLLGTPLIGAMEEAASRIYREQSVSFCSGDACAIENYEKCLLQQIPDQIAKRTKPRDFERVADQKCKSRETSARSILTIDLVNAQKLQISAALSIKTRDEIDRVFKEIRQGTVIGYSEELVKVQPGRRSCLPMCGEHRCLSLEEDSEYKCAISD